VSLTEAEKRLWQRHHGSWQSHYTIRDANGQIVDEHDAFNDIAIDLERNLYAQRNIYTRADGSVEVRRYSAFFEGSELVVRGRILEGRARVYDERTIVLNFRNTDQPIETYETIILMNDIDRARTMAHFENEKLVRVTSVFGEKRISAQPGIDAEGRDLDTAAAG
jgi:hypothetical protein